MCVNIMKFKKIRLFVTKIIYKLPMNLQRITFRAITELRFINFRLKLMRVAGENNPSPTRVYWISTERIKHHTNYLKNGSEETLPLEDRVFGKKMRGSVIDGNWDITTYKFTDLHVYKSFEKRIKDGIEWQNTPLYEKVLGYIDSGRVAWGIKNKDDLDNRCKYLDSLYESIKENGYQLSRNFNDEKFNYDEIDVNIGRDGEYLFQNGVHRLSIAKLLGTKSVPVMVFARHKKWQEFREFVFSYAKDIGGKLYQPIVHPDLADVPYALQDHDCHDLMGEITHHLGQNRGAVLDIGANLGFFCHKFEDLGYRCYAVERDPVTFRVLEKVKIAENKKFEVINKSIFDVDFIKNMKFDVVLALNIFHHFLKTEPLFSKLQNLLKELDADMMIFEAHNYHEDQMKDAYVNYTETEFIDFILRLTSLNKSEVIYTAKNGRKVFKLSK